MEEIFTLRFREELKNSGIKQNELAKQIGISKQCVSDFKSGRAFPSIQTLTLICKHLDVSADYLLGLDNNSSD